MNKKAENCNGRIGIAEKTINFFIHPVYIEWLVTWCMYINEVYSVPVEPDLM